MRKAQFQNNTVNSSMSKGINSHHNNGGMNSSTIGQEQLNVKTWGEQPMNPP